MRFVHSRAVQNIDFAWFKLRDLLVLQFGPLSVNGAGWRFGVPVAEQQGYFFPQPGPEVFRRPWNRSLNSLKSLKGRPSPLLNSII